MTTTQLSFPRNLLPEAPGLTLEDARFVDHEMVAILRSIAPSSPCPLCGAASSSVHSRYRRTPADLPWGGRPVKLVLNVRKFFCKTTSCTRRIFTERLPDVIAPYSRATERLTALLRAVAFALGGEAGSRLAKHIGLCASPTTLISVIRKTPLPEHSPARILGVDDWAHRKGRNYGTALVDLEKHKLIELLEDREAHTFARWLEENPGAEVISRDRSEKYAVGAHQGAPGAVQVADRWHLLANFRDAVQRVFERHRGPIKRIALQVPKAVSETNSIPPESRRADAPQSHEQQGRTRVQSKREARYEAIRERHARGEYWSSIARDLGLDYRTVRKYALSDECPERKPYPGRGSMMDPYEPYLKTRWEEGCTNGQRLYEEIIERGFPGSRSPVARLVARLRREEDGGSPRHSPSAAGEPLTPRKASMLLLREEERRTEAESVALAKLPEAHEDIATTVDFTERFAKIVRERRGGELSEWLSDAESSEVPEIRQFARKARQDEDVIRAGCTLVHSNGQTEGKVAKLKLIKKQMYGRGNFDLLRRRALYAA